VPGTGVLVHQLQGQALDSKLRIGAKVVKVAGVACVGLKTADIFGMVARSSRPVVISFLLPEKERSVSPVTTQRSETPVDGSELVNKDVSMRLRRLTENHQHIPEMTGESQSKTVVVAFQKGALGMKISQIGNRVVVTSFENEIDGSMGQAEKSHSIHFGYQLMRVGKETCEGLDVPAIGALVKAQKRPLEIEFKKLFEKRETEVTRSVYNICTCGKYRDCTQSNPLYFHFLMLAKSTRISMLLEREASADLDEDLPDPDIPSLFLSALDTGIEFSEMPGWIRGKFIEWRLDAGRSITSKDCLPSSIALKTSSNDECCFCSEQRLIQERAAQLDDYLYVHFHFLFQGIKKKEKRKSNRNQQGYLKYLDDIDVSHLYKHCQERGVSLHEWTEWIRAECVGGYEEQLYKVSTEDDIEIDLREMLKEQTNL